MRRGRGLDGRPATEVYVEFVRAVELAEAEAEIAALACIRRAMARDWRAAAWFLENTDSHWRQRRQRAEGSVPDITPTCRDFGSILIDAETLQRLATERVRTERGETEIDDEMLARRARLVSGSP
jgi:hypothetical protein